METQKKALVLLFDQCEECEFMIPVDTLRRAGIAVTIAGVDGNQPVVCHKNVKIIPDVDLKEVENVLFDCVVLPGGPGYERLEKLEKIGNLLRRHYDNNKLIAAICGGPNIVHAHKIGLGKQITSYPPYENRYKDSYKWKNERVVKDGNLITSQAPGTAFEFCLEVVNQLLGSECRKKLAADLIF